MTNWTRFQASFLGKVLEFQGYGPIPETLATFALNKWKSNMTNDMLCWIASQSSENLESEQHQLSVSKTTK